MGVGISLPRAGADPVRSGSESYQVGEQLVGVGSGSLTELGGTSPVKLDGLRGSSIGVVKGGITSLADCDVVEEGTLVSPSDFGWSANICLSPAATDATAKVVQVANSGSRGSGRRKTRAKRVARRSTLRKFSNIHGNRPV